MEVLEKHAMEVSFVLLNVFDGTGWERAFEQDIGAMEALEIGQLVEVTLRGPEGEALEADDAVETPEGKGDAVYEDKLEITLGLEGGYLAREMVIPVRLLLDLKQDGIGGKDAVTRGVGRG